MCVNESGGRPENKKPLKSDATTLQAVWESLLSQIWVRLLYSDGYWLGQARHISSRGQGSDIKNELHAVCQMVLFFSALAIHSVFLGISNFSTDDESS
ncbi:MAG: hypothetical protein DWH91_07160 [Planctomycetota bacterium]|nr:MAG: hypothetical protein DWH91_07160 [Planctomycetota bacterium]